MSEAERMSLLEEAHRQHRAQLDQLTIQLRQLTEWVGKRDPMSSGRSLADRVRSLEVKETQRVIDGPDARRVERVLRAVAVALEGSDDA